MTFVSAATAHTVFAQALQAQELNQELKAAVERDDIAAVQAAWEKGARLEPLDLYSGNTSMMAAAEEGGVRFEIVNWLYEQTNALPASAEPEFRSNGR